MEWLEVKTECPLCRYDFTQEMHDFIQKSDDILNDVAREAISDSHREEAPELDANGNVNDADAIQIRAEQAAANELVQELQNSMGELH